MTGGQGVAGLCRDDDRWQVVELGEDGRWRRVQLDLADRERPVRIGIVPCGPGQVMLRLSTLPTLPTPTMPSADGDLTLEILNGPEDAMCALARHWLDNLAAGRRWNQRPPRPTSMGDFYTDRAWSPPGSRLHVLLRPGIAETLAATYGPVLRHWESVLRPVPTHRLHLTLAWVADPPTAALTEGDRSRVRHHVNEVLAATMPLRAYAPIGVEEAQCAPYGVRCQLHEPEAIVALAQRVSAALANALPEATISAPRPDPHIALAYGTRADADVTDLPGQLKDATSAAWPDFFLPLGVPELLIADIDTFCAQPWDWAQWSTTSWR